ncbi:hypothetical protein [Albidovulum sediminis]|uniref:Uncharacterized protein n=1 Tax=Albidovulum sediminis TaxID=3066345 RepID=A0ABT2NMW8_9RHOB|nr:hypothetical protein [Defluviimonas sediminis]MCT8330251.1 hypothetical protein [Defluviimonas sediminis]
MSRFRIIAFCLLPASPALADAPAVVAAQAVRSGEVWSISVTLSHPDTGWGHYADSWQVETDDGTVIASRGLVHPHVDEQPFTRSLDAVAIPAGLDHVMIRSRCNLDGWSPRPFRLDLTN